MSFYFFNLLKIIILGARHINVTAVKRAQEAIESNPPSFSEGTKMAGANLFKKRKYNMRNLSG